jgi:L-lactate dehydrogenase complex protein LldE
VRVALFITCFNDVLFPEVGRATVRLLEGLGHEVDVPVDQTCCGQIHFNTGYRAACRPLVRHFAETFGQADVIVTPSPSCAAMVRLHHLLVASEDAERSGDEELVRQVGAVVPRVYELSEFLIDVLGVVDVGARFDHAVAFHKTCHSARLLGVGDRPERLLAAVAGLRLVPFEGAETCCGFGGTFAVKNADTSAAMGMDKVAAIAASGAEILASNDTSCLMHLGGLMSRQRLPIQPLHLAEILAHRD